MSLLNHFSPICVNSAALIRQNIYKERKKREREREREREIFLRIYQESMNGTLEDKWRKIENRRRVGPG
jgi:hypothetical protein